MRKWHRRFPWFSLLAFQFPLKQFLRILSSFYCLYMHLFIIRLSDVKHPRLCCLFSNISKYLKFSVLYLYLRKFQVLKCRINTFSGSYHAANLERTSFDFKNESELFSTEWCPLSMATCAPVCMCLCMCANVQRDEGIHLFV